MSNESKSAPRRRATPTYAYEDKSFDHDRRQADLSEWDDLDPEAPTHQPCVYCGEPLNRCECER